MAGKKKEQAGSLGRALVRQKNKAALQAKEKARALGLANRRALESVTDISDLDAVVEQAEEAALVFSADNPSPSVISLDGSAEVSALSPEARRVLQQQEEALHADSLRIPRRPPWDSNMSVDVLDANEKQAFLVWRRNLAKLEENENLVLTPFEKNLDIWRQLWRVLERSDLLVMVVDARNPLFYRCPDLEEYARELDERKKTLLLVNKADLLPSNIRQKWAEYFNSQGILFLFWSAKAAAAAASLEGKVSSTFHEERSTASEESASSNPDTKIYGREELLSRLQSEAEAALASGTAQRTRKDGMSCADERKRVSVGFVGYPNVGKSSTINALVGEKRTGVTSTPGKTKHFQTLIISEQLVLCDCPGLVFPSFYSSRFEMIACGVLPVDRMTEHRRAVQVVADRVRRLDIERIYNIALPRPKPYEFQSRPPSSSELLRAYCLSRGLVSSRGLPDETRASRQILKDYIDGKLPHFEMPPVDEDDLEEGIGDAELLAQASSDESDSEETDMTQVLDDLASYDSAGIPSSSKVGIAARKVSAASHKHHRKPQRKKDRSWRVGNDGTDGMPAVRFFQKPAVDFRAIDATT